MTGEIRASALRRMCLPSKAEVMIQISATRKTKAATTPVTHRPRPVCGTKPLSELLWAMNKR